MPEQPARLMAATSPAARGGPLRLSMNAVIARAPATLLTLRESDLACFGRCVVTGREVEECALVDSVYTHAWQQFKDSARNFVNSQTITRNAISNGVSIGAGYEAMRIGRLEGGRER